MSVSRFYAFGVAGAALVGLGIALVAWAAFGIAQIGSCQTPGPNPCPPDFLVKFFAIFGGVALGLVGLKVAGLRAGRGERTGSLGIACWSTGYLVVGGALVASGFAPSSEAVGADRSGWMIPGFVFIALGLGGVVYGVVRRIRAT